jgi:hypothetical protein
MIYRNVILGLEVGRRKFRRRILWNRRQCTLSYTNRPIAYNLRENKILYVCEQVDISKTQFLSRLCYLITKALGTYADEILLYLGQCKRQAFYIMLNQVIVVGLPPS